MSKYNVLSLGNNENGEVCNNTDELWLMILKLYKKEEDFKKFMDWFLVDFNTKNNSEITIIDIVDFQVWKNKSLEKAKSVNRFINEVLVNFSITSPLIWDSFIWIEWTIKWTKRKLGILFSDEIKVENILNIVKTIKDFIDWLRTNVDSILDNHKNEILKQTFEELSFLDWYDFEKSFNNREIREILFKLYNSITSEDVFGKAFSKKELIKISNKLSELLNIDNSIIEWFLIDWKTKNELGLIIKWLISEFNWGIKNIKELELEIVAPEIVEKQVETLQLEYKPEWPKNTWNSQFDELLQRYVLTSETVDPEIVEKQEDNVISTLQENDKIKQLFIKSSIIKKLDSYDNNEQRVFVIDLYCLLTWEDIKIENLDSKIIKEINIFFKKYLKTTKNDIDKLLNHNKFKICKGYIKRLAMILSQNETKTEPIVDIQEEKPEVEPIVEVQEEKPEVEPTFEVQEDVPLINNLEKVETSTEVPDIIVPNPVIKLSSDINNEITKSPLYKQRFDLINNLDIEKQIELLNYLIQVVNRILINSENLPSENIDILIRLFAEYTSFEEKEIRDNLEKVFKGEVKLSNNILRLVSEVLVINNSKIEIRHILKSKINRAIVVPNSEKDKKNTLKWKVIIPDKNDVEWNSKKSKLNIKDFIPLLQKEINKRVRAKNPNIRDEELKNYEVFVGQFLSMFSFDNNERFINTNFFSRFFKSHNKRAIPKRIKNVLTIMNESELTDFLWKCIDDNNKKINIKVEDLRN